MRRINLLVGSLILTGAIALTSCNASNVETKGATEVAQEATVASSSEVETESIEETKAEFKFNFPELKEVENAKEISEEVRKANTYEALIKNHSSYKQESGHPVSADATDENGNPVEYSYEYNSITKLGENYAYVEQYSQGEKTSSVLIEDGTILLTQPSLSDENEMETDLILTSYANGADVNKPSYWGEQFNLSDYGTIYDVKEDKGETVYSIYNDVIDEEASTGYRYISKITVDSDTKEVKSVVIEQYSNDAPEVEMNGGVSYVVNVTFDDANLTKDELKLYEDYKKADKTTINIKIKDGASEETFTEEGAIGSMCLASAYDDRYMLFYSDEKKENLVFTGEFKITDGLNIYGEYVDEDTYAKAYNNYMTDLYSEMLGESGNSGNSVALGETIADNAESEGANN